MEALIAIFCIGALCGLALLIGKFIWTSGILKAALTTAAISLISGMIVTAITGDPNWGAGGGVSVALFSFFGGAKSA